MPLPPFRYAMHRVISGTFWIALYLGVVLAPLAFMLVPPVPSGRAFWVELSVALGFVGLTQIAVQFVLIARFRRVTAPYGIDVVLQYHKKIALVAVALILAHPFLLLIEHPARIYLFNPFGGTWGSKLGLLAVAALVAIVGTSVWRERLRLNYERWRVSHAVLGVVALAAAQGHVSLAGLYINTPAKQAVWIAVSVALISLVGWLRLVKPARQKARPWRVAEVRDEGGDTVTLVVEPDGHDGLRFRPGQFAWIKTGDNPWTPDEHPYSFASSAEKPERLAFGIRAVGDFSKAVQDLEPGTKVWVDGPHGAFTTDRFEAPAFVFLAGGIGITPFLGILETLADRGDPRPIFLVYAAGSAEELAYRSELHALRERLDLDLVYALDNLPDDLDEPTSDGEAGRLDGIPVVEGYITDDLLDAHLPAVGYDRRYFIVGPPPMMDAAEQLLAERGVPADRVHIEKFDLA